MGALQCRLPASTDRLHVLRSRLPGRPRPR
jgi:hypothetical protein